MPAYTVHIEADGAAPYTSRPIHTDFREDAIRTAAQRRFGARVWVRPPLRPDQTWQIWRQCKESELRNDRVPFNTCIYERADVRVEVDGVVLGPVDIAAAFIRVFGSSMVK